MSQSLSIKLYRYRKINEHTIDSLCRDQLFYSNPIDFNDPLDCRPVVEPDSDNLTLRRILTELIRNRVERETLASLINAKTEKSKMAKHAESVANQRAYNELQQIEYQATDPDYGSSFKDAECWILTNRIQDELLSRYEHGVCCFSSNCDNPLLWSHYGDQHRGICIGYEVEDLTNEQPEKVEYGGSRKITTSLIAEALLDKCDNAAQYLVRKILFLKASSWKYEKEWRMVGDRGLHNSTLALKDITFGLRCSNAFKYVIHKTFERRKDVKFYEMNELRGTFDLKREPFDASFMYDYPRNNLMILKAFSRKQFSEYEG